MLLVLTYLASLLLGNAVVQTSIANQCTMAATSTVAMTSKAKFPRQLGTGTLPLRCKGPLCWIFQATLCEEQFHHLGGAVTDDGARAEYGCRAVLEQELVVLRRYHSAHYHHDVVAP